MPVPQSSKRQRCESGTTSRSQGTQPATNTDVFQNENCFQYQGTFNNITRHDLENKIPELTQAQQRYDLFTIFNAPHEEKYDAIVQAWLDLRNITANLGGVRAWRWGHSCTRYSSLKRAVRAVKTFRTFGVTILKEGKLITAAEVMRKELDYLVLILVVHSDRLSSIPNAVERSLELLKKLDGFPEPRMHDPSPSAPLMSDLQGFSETRLNGNMIPTALKLRENMLDLAHIAGHTRVKVRLRILISSYKRLGKFPGTCMLLFGPPGTGKTALAESLAKKAGISFYGVRADSLFSKHFGETERNFSQIFEQARKTSPSVVFLDGCDYITKSKEEIRHDVLRDVFGLFLQILQDLREEDCVFVVVATNHPWQLDASLLSRFPLNLQYFVGPPTLRDRFEIITHLLDECGLHFGIPDREALAVTSEGLVGRDIELLIKQSKWMVDEEAALSDYYKQITDDKWEPCKADATGAVARSFESFDHDFEAIKIREVAFDDIDQLLRQVPRRDLELKRYNDWDPWAKMHQ